MCASDFHLGKIGRKQGRQDREVEEVSANPDEGPWGLLVKVGLPALVLTPGPGGSLPLMTRALVKQPGTWGD